MKKLIYLLAVLIIVPTGCKNLKKKGWFGSNKKKMKEYIKELESTIKEDSAFYASELERMKKESQERVDSVQQACENALSAYYVITGSFRNPNNAQAFANKMLDLGYKSEIIQAANGFQLVSAYGSNNLSEAKGSLKNLRANVSEDAWIYSAK